MRHGWWKQRLGIVLVGAAMAAATLTVGPASAQTPPIERDASDLVIERPLWSGTIADSLLERSPETGTNPFAVIVQFVDQVPSSAVDALLDGIEGRLVGGHAIAADEPMVYVVETRIGPEQALASLRSSSLVLAAESDSVVRADDLSDDEFVDVQWGLGASPGIDIGPAWTAAADAETVLVGVIDSGVDVDHPDLQSVIWTNPGEIDGNGIDDDNNGYVDDIHGWDFWAYDNDPSDESGHGTHVAGTIAAVVDNTIGVAGVARNVEIVPLRFLNADGNGFTSDAIAAVEYAIDNGIDITNNSWGGGSPSRFLDAAIASDPGHLFVAAAGNANNDNDAAPSYPASSTQPNIFSVASHTSNGERSGFSNFGVASVDVSAPGSAIPSTYVVGGTPVYASLSGTSMASPHVAGVAALVMGINPDLTATDIIELVMRTSRWTDPSIIDSTASGGHLDAARAAAAADPAAPTIAITSVAAAQSYGSRIVLEAAVTSDDLDPSIVWYVESADGALDGSVVGTGSSVELTLTAAGRVRVRAEVTEADGRWNVATHTLDVDAVIPSAPEAVELSAGDAQIDVSWSAPTSNGGAAIAAYTATASPGGASCSALSTSCTIDGLTNGQAYTVAVTAENAVGVGPASDTAGPATPVSAATVPTPPRAVLLTPGDQTLSVAWQSPLSAGGSPITEYVATASPGGATCATSSLSCTIGDLSNGQPYTVTVVAANAVGASPASEASAPSIPVAGPAAPQAVAVEPGDGELGVSWSAPASDGGSPVTGYVATASPGGAACSTASTECTISGLSNGQAYTVAVTAQNAVGAGPASVAGPATPSAPDLDPPVQVAPPEMTPDPEPEPEIDGDPPVQVAPPEMTPGEMPSACDGTRVDSGFSDVSSSSFASGDVGCLVALSVTTGTTASTFSPGDVVTREQMAAFLARLYRTLSGASCAPSSSGFADVSSSSFASADVGCLVSLGVTTGTSSSTFSPGDVVTREQMAAFLARLYRTLSGASCAPSSSGFADVSSSSFASADVGCLVSLGVTTGTSSSTFSPGDVVTREQMAAFLARLYRTVIAA